MQILDPLQLIFKAKHGLWMETGFQVSALFLMSQHVLLLMGETAVQRGPQAEQKWVCSHQGLLSPSPSALEKAVEPTGSTGATSCPSAPSPHPAQRGPEGKDHPMGAGKAPPCPCTAKNHPARPAGSGTDPLRLPPPPHRVHPPPLPRAGPGKRRGGKKGKTEIKKKTAGAVPGWARTTNLSVNSRTR